MVHLTSGKKVLSLAVVLSSFLVMTACTDGGSSSSGTQVRATTPTDAHINLQGLTSAESKVAKQLLSGEVNRSELYTVLKDRVLAFVSQDSERKTVEERIDRLVKEVEKAVSLEHLKSIVVSELFTRSSVRNQYYYDSRETFISSINKSMVRLLKDGIYNREALTELMLILSLKMKSDRFSVVSLYKEGLRVPGYVTKTGETWRLYGLDLAFNDTFLRTQSYGLNRDLKSAVRVVSVEEDLAFRAFADRVYNAKDLEKKILQNTAHSYSVPWQQLEEKISLISSSSHSLYPSVKKPFFFGRSYWSDQRSSWQKSRNRVRFIGENESIWDRASFWNVESSSSTYYDCSLFEWKCNKKKASNPFVKRHYVFMSSDGDIPAFSTGATFLKKGEVQAVEDSQDSYIQSRRGCLLEKKSTFDESDLFDQSIDHKDLVGYPAQFKLSTNGLEFVILMGEDLKIRCKGVQTAGDFVEEIGFISKLGEK